MKKQIKKYVKKTFGSGPKDKVTKGAKELREQIERTKRIDDKARGTGKMTVPDYVDIKKESAYIKKQADKKVKDEQDTLRARIKQSQTQRSKKAAPARAKNRAERDADADIERQEKTAKLRAARKRKEARERNKAATAKTEKGRANARKMDAKELDDVLKDNGMKKGKASRKYGGKIAKRASGGAIGCGKAKRGLGKNYKKKK